MLHSVFPRPYHPLSALFPKGNKATAYITSSYKKRKLSPSLEPNENNQQPLLATDPASSPQLAASDGSAWTLSPSEPRFLPQHLLAETNRSARSPTPEPPQTGGSSPITAYAGLNIDSDGSTYGSGAEAVSGRRRGSQSAARLRGGAPSQRTASPAKRRASNMGGGGRQVNDKDTEMSHDDHELSNQVTIPSIEVGLDSAGSPTPSEDQASKDDRDLSNLMLGQEPEDSALNPPPRGTLPRGSAASGNVNLPPVDDQIRQVMELVQGRNLKEGERGYIIANKWLSRVIARGSDSVGSNKYGKEAKEGPIGPVDNRDIELVVDPSAKVFKDEDEEVFIPLKPGLSIGEDFEILPESAWNLILEWYGHAQGSPVITRFCHDTSPSDDAENFQYEIYPPIVTILKLPDRSGGMTAKGLKEKTLAPARLLVSRHEGIQRFLKRAKSAAGIDLATKVRTWRIYGGLTGGMRSGMITPAQSRSSSPAPGAMLPVDPGTSLVLDLNTFAGLQLGSEKEFVEVKDETLNDKYNGRSNLDFVGLRQDSVIVLEEQIGGPAGGEWVSDSAISKAKANGVQLGASKNVAQNALKASSAGSRGSSPGPSMMTRGRQAKSGRILGTIGLNNLGNTCYMNSALQCVRSVEELTKYFLEDKYKKELNVQNPLAHNGHVAKAYATLLHEMYNPNSTSSFAPRNFKNIIGRYGPSFSGYQQQDSQEFLLFLLDGLQEDLNRIYKKPYIEKPDSTDEMVNNPAALREMADKCWDIYKKRNDSVITDLFAGMYKSTVVCPICDKVSIIFDPFNNLTLQLPIENVWSKTIIYFPLNARPVIVAVDIDKNASFRGLKEYVSAKFPSTDSKKLIVAEIYKNKFYKIFDDNKTISEETIVDTDTIAILELEDQPTNWPPPSKTIRKKSYYTTSYSTEEIDIPDDSSPIADKILVSVFHRQSTMGATRLQASKALFGAPAFIVLNREEARDYDSILRKVLAKVANMTTRNFLTEDESMESTAEESDAVLMSAEDADTDSKVHTESLESEDGMVDISMKDPSEIKPPSHVTSDTAESKPLPKILQRDGFIPQSVRDLFDIKHITTDNEMVPLGWQSLGDEVKTFPSLSSRLHLARNRPAANHKSAMDRINDKFNGADNGSSDEDIDDPPALTTQARHEDSDSEGLPDVESLQPAPSKISSTFRRKGKQTVSRDSDEDDVMNDGSDEPLVRLGEALILDWTPEGYDALFGGSEIQDDDDDEMRGAKTWDDIPAHPDPQLEQRRQARASRRKNGISLDDCLDEFGKPEILSENDAWYCPRCKEHRRASKKFELWKSPDILVIHLKRFSAQGRFRDKLDVRVDFPVEGLDLTSRVAMHDNESMIYDLFAVDNHYGGLGGGHYTAFAQNFIDQNWYEYNDSAVSKRSNPENAVVTSAAYLLFYRRRTSQPLGGPFFESLFVEDSINDSQPASRTQSPSGEGKRLDEASSRNGSSSALRGVGAAHQTGGGGLEANEMSVERMRTGVDDQLPAYSVLDSQRNANHMSSGVEEDEGIADVDEDAVYHEHGPFTLDAPPTWSFAAANNSPETGEPDATENLFETDSNRVGSATSADERNRMLDFDEDPGTTHGHFGTPPQGLPMLEGVPAIGSFEEEDAPVTEVKLPPDEKDELEME